MSRRVASRDTFCREVKKKLDYAIDWCGRETEWQFCRLSFRGLDEKIDTSHVCTINMQLQLAAVGLAQRLETGKRKTKSTYQRLWCYAHTLHIAKPQPVVLTLVVVRIKQMWGDISISELNWANRLLAVASHLVSIFSSNWNKCILQKVQTIPLNKHFPRSIILSSCHVWM